MTYQMRQKLLNGLDAKELKEINDFHAAYNKAKEEPNIHKSAESLRHLTKYPGFEKLIQYKFILDANAKLLDQFVGRRCVIRVPINRFRETDNWITCEGSVGFNKFTCIVSCGFWHKVKPNEQETKLGYINLLDHLADLVPKTGTSIGFITFQNGINNTLENFKRMGAYILGNLRERPLCIGIYNPTKGLLADASGVLKKLEGELSDTICVIYMLFTAIAEKLKSINKDLLWMHIAHSEGGLILESALTLLKKDISEFFRTHLLVATYGAVLPTPTRFAIAINTYSNLDGATLPRVKSYLTELGEAQEDYKIKFVDSSQNLNYLYLFGVFAVYYKVVYERLVGDHSFLNTTYQNELKEDIDDFKRHGPIYEGK